MGDRRDVSDDKSKSDTQKLFSDDPDQVSYYRWLHYALEKFRNVCQNKKRIAERIEYMHRPTGPWPIADQEIENKIDRAHEMQRKIFEALGKRENESLDLFHQRMVEKRRNHVAVAMTELGAIDHWQPPIKDYGLRPKQNPRRPMTEQAMIQRNADAEKFIGEFMS